MIPSSNIKIMETSKDYFESVIRDFKTYGRGRTLEQNCRDEAVDDNKCMKPIFSKIAATHTITRSQLMLLLTGALARTIKIN